MRSMLAGEDLQFVEFLPDTALKPVQDHAAGAGIAGNRRPRRGRHSFPDIRRNGGGRSLLRRPAGFGGRRPGNADTVGFFAETDA